MSGYANLKIGRKLACGFAIVLCVAIVLGYLGLAGMQKIDGMLDTMYRESLLAIVDLSNANTKAIHERMAIRAFLLESNPVERETTRLKIARFEVEFQENLDLYRKIPASDEEKEIRRKFDLAWIACKTSYSQLLSAAHTSEPEEIKNLNLAIDREFGSMANILSELIAINQREAEKSFTESEAISRRTFGYILVLSMASVAVGGVLAFFIGRSIVVPLRIVSGVFGSLARSGADKVKIAEAIAGGDLSKNVAVTEKITIDSVYSRRQDETGELLRSVADMGATQTALDVAFGKMTEALRHNKEENDRRDWLKSGMSELNNAVRGEQDLPVLTDNVLRLMAEYLKAGVGALYIYHESEQELELTASYAFTRRKNLGTRFKLKEGLIGQAAWEKKMICLSAVPSDYLPIGSAMGESSPCAIVAVPLLHEGKMIGAMELGAFRAFSQTELEFLNQAVETLAIGISVNLSRHQVNQLLKQSQRQEEELRTQQEELQQTNEELEERAQLLEQQREQIQAKNREVEQASHEVLRKAGELERVSTYKSEFLANMSHELRTPLNSLMILSGLLKDNKDGNLTQKQVEFAATIHGAGKDLLTLINDILDLSKIESGKMEFNYEDTPLADMPGQIETAFKPMAEQKGLAFKIDVETTAPATIRIDAQRTLQIIKNLLANAIKFTRNGSVSLRIYSPPAEETPLSVSSIAFAVIDTGIGIAADKHELIFNAFKQADGTTSRKYGGTGLGLSISRQLASGMNGVIKLASQEGRGSVFTLYLPVLGTKNPAQKAAVVAIPQLAHAELASPAAGSPVAADGVAATLTGDQLPPPALPDDREGVKNADKCILIIEDDIKFAKVLMEMVRQRGFAAIVATDGDSGIALAEHYLPSAIILDVMLPGTDGWGVMRHLTGNPRTRHTPIHFITCMEDRQKAMSMGAIGFVTKPVSQEQISKVFDTIESAVSQTVKKLLVVEDDERELKSIVALLEERNIAISVAQTGKAAVEQLSHGTFDCIVLDLGLTDMSGFELLEHIHKLEQSQRIPVIIHSGRELTHEEETRLRRYAESIIIKGAKSPERLLNEVTLFLHVLESRLPPDKQKMIRASLGGEGQLEGKKILIVDDDMRNVFSLSSYLAEMNISIIEAENGKEALAKLDANPDADAVLMDMMMPEMDGYEATRAIRRDARFANLPVIALTAKAMKGDEQACLKAGASDYLPKPIDMGRLMSMLRVWLYKAA